MSPKNPILERFRECRVLVVGDMMLDEYIWGHVRRICSEAPVPVVEEFRRTAVPGGAANVAMNVCALGAKVSLVGIRGGDTQGATLENALILAGVGTDAIFTDGARPTATKTRIIAHSQQVVRVDREDTRAVSNVAEQQMFSWIEDRLSAVDCCVLSDYSKGVLSPTLISNVISQANRLRCPVIVDPKGWDYRKYRGASIITPNLQEAPQALANGSPPAADVDAIGAGLLGLLPGTSVIATLGADGVMLFREGEVDLHIRSSARDVFDVTGAGDTLVATLAVATAAGWPIERSLAVENCAAGLSVAKVGTVAVTAAELINAIDSSKVEFFGVQ